MQKCEKPSLTSSVFSFFLEINQVEVQSKRTSIGAKMRVILSTPPRQKPSKNGNSFASPPPSLVTARSRLSMWRDFLEFSPGKALAHADQVRDYLTTKKITSITFSSFRAMW